jgi:hypothetical protein
VDNAVQICLVCETPLDPDDDVIQFVHTSSDGRTGYAHIDEDAQVMALGGWIITRRGRLRDLTSKDVTESSDRL